ncbi:MAG TPA: hypothetical protein VK541_19250 [Pedobacter sp.]|uniref:hypothetical protein n=1 Tax=Pedobacter sp. TaxID=1411316 RepID=UPI002BB93D27|nr:hypothetical protein [Pedobacter sp.]HMI04636.1 hypothetical protein [Pedobacter sp.]
MPLKLNLEKEDIDLLVQTIENAITNEALEKTRLKKILDTIKLLASLDDDILQAVINFLKPQLPAPGIEIKPDSNLEFGLGINTQWIKNSLHTKCNNTVRALLTATGSTKTPAKITSAEAVACLTVKDIVNLIKKTYENAA